MIGTQQVVAPIPAATSVARRPSGPAARPAMSEPSGIVPQYMKRTTEFMRPSSRWGVIAWRSVSWLTFAKKPNVVPTKPMAARTGAAGVRGTSGTAMSVHEKAMPENAIIGPMPYRRTSRWLTNAPSTRPDVPSALTMPISVALQCRSRT